MLIGSWKISGQEVEDTTSIFRVKTYAVRSTICIVHETQISVVIRNQLIIHVSRIA